MVESQNYDVFQAIADPTRRKMLVLLANEEMPVTMISNHFSISRPAISKHLRILSAANLVTSEKIGREMRYQLQPETLQEFKQWLSFFDQFWENKIAMLQHIVEQDQETNKSIKNG
ncbi:ArsR/SmtB family transcription factor [Halalkalibacter krulwichiae]|uniref:Transcriptional repressor SdpR n=1 Tax=Halalkalibacter krulwichiae TaxID=199441 RepID=A0A1X9MAT7_9BACI|nr:metalloregulator ArsR/SmtB family transcription factor [Halalkalibacter krulwichiae]ARK30518.1 Transcriptional repressor SdpR [Halalkalibacter krulwichiae]